MEIDRVGILGFGLFINRIIIIIITIPIAQVKALKANLYSYYAWCGVMFWLNYLCDMKFFLLSDAAPRGTKRKHEDDEDAWKKTFRLPAKL